MEGNINRNGFNNLLKAVVERALLDANGNYTGISSKKFRETSQEKARFFLTHEDCEVYCLETGLDYDVIKARATK